MVATTQAVRTTLDDGDRSIKPRWRANLRRALDRADSASALVAELIRGDLPDDVRDWLGPRITVGRWPGWAQMTVVLAWGLERRLWSPPDTGGVKVAFLGASSLEASGCHDVEGALSELLGLDVQVDLVGPRLEGLSGPSGPDRRIYEERGTPRGFAMPVEACWRAGVLEKPDVAVMMHPGVVVSEDFWLCDEGLKTWVQGGVPVLVTAFTDEEAERDAELLESAGYVVGDLVQNVFGEEFVEKDDCIGGSTFWAAVLYPILGVDSERWSRRKVEVDDVGIDKSTEIRSLPLDVRRLASAVLRSNGNMGVTRRLVAPEQTSARQYRRADVAHGLLAAKRLDRFYEYAGTGVAAWSLLSGRGEQSVHVAAAHGLIDGVKAAIHSGADVWAEDDFGYTPWIRAVANGHFDVARLLESRADNESPIASDALLAAQVSGHVDAMEYVLGRMRGPVDEAVNVAVLGAQDLVRVRQIRLAISWAQAMGRGAQHHQIDEATFLGLRYVVVDAASRVRFGGHLYSADATLGFDMAHLALRNWITRRETTMQAAVHMAMAIDILSKRGVSD